MIFGHFQIPCSLQREFQKNKTCFITVQTMPLHTFMLNTEVRFSLKKDQVLAVRKGTYQEAELCP